MIDSSTLLGPPNQPPHFLDTDHTVYVDPRIIHGNTNRLGDVVHVDGR